MKMSRKWIFLRGLGRHSSHWGPFVEVFKSEFPDDEIEFLDLRGNGTLAHSSSFHSIADNVRDLRTRSRWVNENQKFFLLTLSFGSMIGVEWARQHPEEVSGLVAMNSSDRGTSTVLKRMLPGNFLFLLGTLARGRNPQWLENNILKLTTNLFEAREELAPQFSSKTPTSRLNVLKQLYAAATYEFPQQKPKTEILLLSGKGDRLVHSDCTQSIAQMWTMKSHVHPSAGHDLPLDAPQWVCKEIKTWLDLCP